MKDQLVKSQSKFDIEINITLTEVEARALRELTVYGSETFLKVFYEKLGRSTLEEHEKGLISLFETIRQELPKHLNKADQVRELLKPKP